jgi:uncharacterized protein YuzE
VIIISDIDRYISTTWGASIRLEAGVPKSVGEDIGLVCLQEGCKRVEEDSKPVDNKIEIEVKEESINFEDMTKIELEEYGRTIGIELDRRKKKSDLIEELNAAG